MMPCVAWFKRLTVACVILEVAMRNRITDFLLIADANAVPYDKGHMRVSLHDVMGAWFRLLTNARATIGLQYATNSVLTYLIFTIECGAVVYCKAHMRTLCHDCMCAWFKPLTFA